MNDHAWQQARLIPTSGITGNDEAERRATSALLAVMCAVRDFASSITRPFGAAVAAHETFIEVPFKLGEHTVIPDGLIRVSRGSKSWVALVEVKTGTNDLRSEQIESYLDVAREQGFDCVLTISNQISPAPGVHPVAVDRRKLRKVDLHHLSWAEILTIAVQHRVHRGLSDPEQAWILGELIRYLEHPRSGALDFADMGAEWVTIREAVSAGTLRPTDKALSEVVSRWDQLLRFAALRLGRELGADVQLVLSRKELADPLVRFSEHCASLARDGVLRGAIRVPDAVGPIDVVADVRGGRVVVSIDVDAPKEGRQATRVNWLVRQLKEAPENVRIDAWASQQRTGSSELLRVVREDSNVLILDPAKDLKSFRVAAVSPMGAKRTAGRGSLIDSVLAAVDGFYEAVVQELRPWTPKAPQLPSGQRGAVAEAGIDVSVPLSDLEPVASTSVDSGTVTEAPESTSREMEEVDWSDAQDRIDDERALGGQGASDAASPLHEAVDDPGVA